MSESALGTDLLLGSSQALICFTGTPIAMDRSILDSSVGNKLRRLLNFIFLFMLIINIFHLMSSTKNVKLYV